MCIDFLTIYLLTGTPKVALGFMLASNIYTTIAYYVHERVWSRMTIFCISDDDDIRPSRKP